jgi:hypothetical protein
MATDDVIVPGVVPESVPTMLKSATNETPAIEAPGISVSALKMFTIASGSMALSFAAKSGAVAAAPPDGPAPLSMPVKSTISVTSAEQAAFMRPKQEATTTQVILRSGFCEVRDVSFTTRPLREEIS